MGSCSGKCIVGVGIATYLGTGIRLSDDENWCVVSQPLGTAGAVPAVDVYQLKLTNKTPWAFF